MVAPLDVRLLKQLVFLFEVEQMSDPPHYALYDDTVEEGPRSTDWLEGTGPAGIVSDHGLDSSYWNRMQHSRRTPITITQQEVQLEPWFTIKAEVATRNQYPVTCKSHQCVKVLAVLPTKVCLHAPEPLHPEALDSVEEMLREMLPDTALARIRRPAVTLLPRAYMEPIPTPPASTSTPCPAWPRWPGWSSRRTQAPRGLKSGGKRGGSR